MGVFSSGGLGHFTLHQKVQITIRNLACYIVSRRSVEVWKALSYITRACKPINFDKK